MNFIIRYNLDCYNLFLIIRTLDPNNQAFNLNHVSVIERKRNNILYIFIGILFIGGVCYFVYHNYKKNHTTQEGCPRMN
jgi:hypothetical protein